MPLELVPPLIGLTFLAIYAMAGGLLVQTRRDTHSTSADDRRPE
jgi:hypothetical protein